MACGRTTPGWASPSSHVTPPNVVPEDSQFRVKICRVLTPEPYTLFTPHFLLFWRSRHRAPLPTPPSPSIPSASMAALSDPSDSNTPDELRIMEVSCREVAVSREVGPPRPEECSRATMCLATAAKETLSSSELRRSRLFTCNQIRRS